MASYLILIHMNVKEFKPKIHLMKFKFKFWFRTSKSEQQCVEQESIWQRTVKKIHNKTHLLGKKLSGSKTY
jgi:hypothetical protein